MHGLGRELLISSWCLSACLYIYLSPW